MFQVIIHTASNVVVNCGKFKDLPQQYRSNAYDRVAYGKVNYRMIESETYIIPFENFDGEILDQSMVDAMQNARKVMRCTDRQPLEYDMAEYYYPWMDFIRAYNNGKS